jgi:hypothetical protein
MPSNEPMQAMIMPDDDAGICFTLEFYTPDGVWLYTLRKNRRRTFEKHLDELGSQWKKGDPDIFNKMMVECIKADMQTNRTNA